MEKWIEKWIGVIIAIVLVSVLGGIFLLAKNSGDASYQTHLQTLEYRVAQATVETTIEVETSKQDQIDLVLNKIDSENKTLLRVEDKTVQTSKTGSRQFTYITFK